jgi:hypothetical protein
MILRVTGDPMAGAHDATELLDVDMKEFSGMLWECKNISVNWKSATSFKEPPLG